MIAVAAGDVGGGKAEACEADVVVAPIHAEAVDIRRAVAIIEFRAEQDVNRQAVLRRATPQAAGGNPEGGRQAPDFLHRSDLRENLAIARDQNAHIVMVTERARERGGHFTEPPGLDVIGDLGGDEKDGLTSFDGNGRLSTSLQFGVRHRWESHIGFQVN
jgi:hypothetical protein